MRTTTAVLPAISSFKLSSFFITRSHSRKPWCSQRSETHTTQFHCFGREGHFLHYFLVGLLPLRSTRDCHEMNTELENYLSQSLLYLPSTVLRSSHNVSVMSKLLVGLNDRPVTKSPWGSWGKEEKPVKIVGAVSSNFSPSVAIKDPEIPKTATLMVNICEQYIDDWIRTRHLGPLGPLRECEHGHPKKKA